MIFICCSLCHGMMWLFAYFYIAVSLVALMHRGDALLNEIETSATPQESLATYMALHDCVTKVSRALGPWPLVLAVVSIVEMASEVQGVFEGNATPTAFDVFVWGELFAVILLSLSAVLLTAGEVEHLAHGVSLAATRRRMATTNPGERAEWAELRTVCSQHSIMLRSGGFAFTREVGVTLSADAGAVHEHHRSATARAVGGLTGSSRADVSSEAQPPSPCTTATNAARRIECKSQVTR